MIAAETIDRDVPDTADAVGLAAPVRVPLGRLRADAVTFDEAIDRIVARVHSREGGYVVTPNVDHVCVGEDDAEFRMANRDAFLSLADGRPLVWLASWLRTPLPAKISGSDLLMPLMERAEREDLSVFLLGATEATCEKAVRIFERECPTLRVAGFASPLFDPEHPRELEESLEKVRAARPDLVVVAMGTPKQEYLLWRYAESYAPAVALGFGASLDFLTGASRRAPQWMSDAGVEWLFRLLQEPRRLWRRYLVRDRAMFGIALRMYREQRRRPSVGADRDSERFGSS